MLRKQEVLILALLFLLVLTVLGLAIIVVGFLQPQAEPVALPTSLPTATYTVTPTATPTETPSPTPIPQFGPITFGTGIQGEQVVNTGYTFPAGTTEVYAVWSYRGMSSGTPYRLSWFLDGNLRSDQPLAWDAGRYGPDGMAYTTQISEYDTDGLPPGNYRLELFIGQRQVQVATFVVMGPPPTVAPPTPTPQPDIRTVGRQVARSLVQIWVPSDGEGSGGSGSIVDGDRGLIVTNWHVVSDWMGELLSEGGYAAIYLTTDPDEPPVFTYWAQVQPEFSDPDLDLAVLQITHWAYDNTPVYAPLDLPAVPLGDSAVVRRGDHVLLLGFPDYAGGTLSWTEGAVVTRDEWWIKSDAEISHGHSGGMMLSERGELIGIPTQYEATSVGGVLALARPVNLARSLIATAAAAGSTPPVIAPSPGGASVGERMMVLGVRLLNLRNGPSLDDQAVGTIPGGTIVEALQEPVWDGERFWYYVQVQGSLQVGWASGRYLAYWETATSPILFQSNRAGSFDIYRVFPDGTGLEQLTYDPGDEGDASWSPGRDYIVFTSNRSDNSDLYLMKADGGPWIQLTGGPANDIHPVWSPNASRIAFVSDRDDDWELFVVNVDGTGLRQLTFNDAWDSFPTWSPDSAQLAFTSLRTGNYDLFVLDLAIGVETQLTSSPYSDAHPSWAPQGDEIVYTIVVPEGGALSREIGVLSIYDPVHPRRVTSSGPGKALHRYPDWSPDGQWIVFTSERDGNEEIYLIPASGGEVTNLTNAPMSGESAPAWSR